jgi:hypothetical protein
MKIFVSYATKNEKWAKWVVWELENAKQRYECIVQFRDFAPGMNFMEQMRLAARANCTMALFSPQYFASNYCSQEMDAALTGKSSRLLPVRVQKCTLERFLANRIYIDLVGAGLDQARERLLSGVEAYATRTLQGRSGSKFRTRPSFPGKLESNADFPEPPAPDDASEGPLRILFLAPEVGGLDPRGQLRDMQSSVNGARYPEGIQFKGVFKARIDTLFEELNRELPDVFHFSGKQSGGDILMRTDDGSLTTVHDMALAGMFRCLDKGLQLVVVDTCNSLRCARTIANAVPCAIGVEGSPYETEAVRFYSVFYQAVASGRSLKDAVAKAQTALQFEKVPADRIPQLCCRPGVDPAAVVLASGRGALRANRTNRGTERLSG